MDGIERRQAKRLTFCYRNLFRRPLGTIRFQRLAPSNGNEAPCA
jgi:hypothetical protein